MSCLEGDSTLLLIRLFLSPSELLSFEERRRLFLSITNKHENHDWFWQQQENICCIQFTGLDQGDIIGPDQHCYCTIIEHLVKSRISMGINDILTLSFKIKLSYAYKILNCCPKVLEYYLSCCYEIWFTCELDY